MIKRTPEEQEAHKKALWTLLDHYSDYFGSYDPDKLSKLYDEYYKNFLEGRKRVWNTLDRRYQWTLPKGDPRLAKNR